MSSTAKTASSAPAWRRPQVLAIAGVLVLALAAGGWFFLLRDADGAYCEDLQTWKDQSVESPPADAATDPVAAGEFAADRISNRIDGAKKFASDGPGDVKQDWEIYSEGLQNIVETVKDAIGYDLSDAESVQQFIADVQSNAIDVSDPAISAQLQAAQAGLTSKEATDAINAVTKDAKDRCDIDLGTATQVQ